ncbi:carboxymuconolactone decarboxylase family protein [Salinicoccus halodurans]|uniref:Alkylhydroperoxidase n=1 Tax=Salinicoccus halodurans TaxID=407035 RepID=A0A0F7D4C0_9STAP|nr:carboxymuconolactone decarboxylase family protein [Salinicoccus halodurans]AKG73970.1 alkylhydroperoxidase [Salinicoccus halodurans]SFK58659.1 alkylhydroperoxidase AhpD family core domain-containing protein [Salinicoccus halodurans]
MASNFNNINLVAQENTKRLQKTIPDTMKSFKALQDSAYKAGALDEKTKEFAALSFAIADKCEGCIGNHVNKLIKLGATREEIAEIAGVAIVMGGGPGSVYGGKALQAYDDSTDA